MTIGKGLGVNLTYFMGDQINKLVFRTIAVSIFLLLLVVFFFWSRLPPQLPLYYSLPWGIDQIGTPLELIFVLSGAGLLFLLNTLFAVVLKPSQAFFSRLLFLGGAGIVLLTVITVVQIMLLVT